MPRRAAATHVGLRLCWRSAATKSNYGVQRRRGHAIHSAQKVTLDVIGLAWRAQHRLADVHAEGHGPELAHCPRRLLQHEAMPAEQPPGAVTAEPGHAGGDLVLRAAPEERQAHLQRPGGGGPAGRLAELRLHRLHACNSLAANRDEEVAFRDKAVAGALGRDASNLQGGALRCAQPGEPRGGGPNARGQAPQLRQLRLAELQLQRGHAWHGRSALRPQQVLHEWHHGVRGDAVADARGLLVLHQGHHSVEGVDAA
mmetsp:Transcript_3620/g.11326  ORF Transcript_3620/g.11326 Transcript_3620/m.11326 type:complete len:256 (+) Transcript_3620:384-1151(+)